MQRSAGTVVQRYIGPAVGSEDKTSSRTMIDASAPTRSRTAVDASTQTRADPPTAFDFDAHVDIDKLVDKLADRLIGLVSRHLRAEFRIDRERFGRLRDSTR
jgi:hypothetical protein